jgi:hypothetical protein
MYVGMGSHTPHGETPESRPKSTEADIFRLKVTYSNGNDPLRFLCKIYRSLKGKPLLMIIDHQKHKYYPDNDRIVLKSMRRAWERDRRDCETGSFGIRFVPIGAFDFRSVTKDRLTLLEMHRCHRLYLILCNYPPIGGKEKGRTI